MQYWYSHWSKVPTSIWKWNSFKPEEIASKGDGSIIIDTDAMDKLQKMRDIIKKPLIITSAYRDPIHNAKVGGAPKSFHTMGRAFDISVHKHNVNTLKQAAKKAGFGGIAVAKTFIHVDTGRPRTWNY